MPRFREHGLPSTAPQWHGGHLLLAWHMLRDGRLFFPWFERSRAGVRMWSPTSTPRRLQLELRDLLKASGSWQNLLADALDYDGRNSPGKPRGRPARGGTDERVGDHARSGRRLPRWPGSHCRKIASRWLPTLLQCGPDVSPGAASTRLRPRWGQRPRRRIDRLTGSRILRFVWEGCRCVPGESGTGHFNNEKPA